MRLALLPKDPGWWVWLVVVLLLAAGLAGVKHAFLAALLLAAGQAGYVVWRHRSWRPMPAQIRLGYTVLLVLCHLPGMHWLFWLAAVGASVSVLFGYCMMSRILSLMPWNRREALTFSLLGRTFLP